MDDLHILITTLLTNMSMQGNAAGAVRHDSSRNKKTVKFLYWQLRQKSK